MTNSAVPIARICFVMRANTIFCGKEVRVLVYGRKLQWIRSNEMTDL